MVKLSIITINRNNEDGLRETIKSVLNQTNNNYQYIIIDGDSIDNSVEVLKQNENNITYWISEPDKGIYDAMNKGIIKAEGEYILFLNSGDIFDNDEVLMKVSPYLTNYDIVYGDYRFPDGTKKIFPDFLTPYNFFISSLGHQATFFKKIIFDTYGLYKEDLKIVGDWEFYIRTIIFGKVSYKHINQIIALFDTNNQYLLNPEKNRIEKDKILEEYYGPFINDMIQLKDKIEELRQYKKPFTYKLKKKFRLILNKLIQ